MLQSQAAVAHALRRINNIMCDSCYDAREYSSASLGISNMIIKGGGLLPGWVKLPVRVIGGASPPRPPSKFIVSDILDSEIHDRTRVLYSYSYLRGSYEIEADLTMHALIAARNMRRRRPPIACSAFRSYSFYIFPNTIFLFPTL